ncbi:MAG: hypothetical protein IPP02_08560 [Chitinophagaceae bacterium]|nr:hypothetical protein [Chitinophagaceae bacterium]MBK9464410.1 hypothetical protein [Chitinophagaceae bacterium]MBK9658463.1 hypothetical protein [Chitinophagaceae bacterium]MBK9938423.1 hypothetical protein [Chitinophagaceae bacterium]MBL0069039.1 hypothetical protein [Chitinophagaceae bacterium]
MNKQLLFVVLVLPFCTTAQVTWQKVPGPNEGISSIATTSTNIVYAGTSTYGVFRSVDDGSTWANISLGLPDSLIRSLQVSSTDKLFAGTGTHGVYQYSAGTWTAINNGLPVTNILVTGFATGAGGNMYMMATTGKIYSWDGTIWTDITFNFPALGRAIATGPGGIVYAGAFASGVYKFNGVNNWTIVGNAMSNNFVFKMTVGANDTIYVACNANNVFRCHTSGGNWVSANTGLPGADASFVFADAQNRLFIGNTTAAGALYRSINNGDSWSLVSSGMYTTLIGSIAASPSGNIYAGASGVFKSTNGGSVWNDMNPGMDARRVVLTFTSTQNGTLFVGTRSGPWRSLDNGTTWQLRNTGISHLPTLQIMSNAAGDILCHGVNATPKGAIYRSTNNGDNWTLVAANGCDRYTKIKQHKADTLWATSQFSGATTLSYSINNGANWLNNPLTISAIWDIDFNKESTIFVGSESEGVSRSDNGGQTFTLGVGNSIPWYGNVIEVETDVNGVIFAGGDWWTHNLWYSSPEDNGNVWTQFTDPDLVIHGVQDLVFDQRNNAYIACENDGVRMANYTNGWSATTDWIVSSTGLPSPLSNMLEFGFDTFGYIYVVCHTADGHNAGLFRSTVPVNPPASATYTFTGNGNWDVASNWTNNIIPPAILSGNAMIVINPAGSGECVLNISQQVTGTAIFKLVSNKKFTVAGSLTITQ